ncbi:MAG TPA: hypothetical protein VET66_07130 [Steroidobacteraceae bacterium]|nr:hypothetical protein [Steroidobacteraceae bacterium]
MVDPWRQARRHRLHRDPAAHRLELMRIQRPYAHVLDRAAPEAVLARGDHSISYVHILVHIDVGDIDHSRPFNDDVVDHTWSTPTVPRGHTHETGASPPRHQRLTPAERDPSHSGCADANADSEMRAAEKGH